MGDSLLLVITAALSVFTLTVCLVNSWQLAKQNRLLRRIKMNTADVLAALEAANELTTEIGSDIDALIALVGSNDGVPEEVANAVNALKDRLAEAAAKFTPEA
jgi:flagellar basal body-associated protein FliL